MEITKAQKKVVKQVIALGPTFASAAMIASDLGLKVKTVSNHLKALQEKGAVTATECNFHKNTLVFEATQETLDSI